MYLVVCSERLYKRFHCSYMSLALCAVDSACLTGCMLSSAMPW